LSLLVRFDDVGKFKLVFSTFDFDDLNFNSLSLLFIEVLNTSAACGVGVVVVEVTSGDATADCEEVVVVGDVTLF
jgi:hypothetical protein